MVAKGMYVDTRSGWFSERSLCYLASGRPVLAQDTGLERPLPAGEGLLAFSTLDEAVAGVEAIRADIARHAAAARELAEAHFDSDRVLSAAARPVAARRAGMTTVIVSGAVANKHRHGGSAWVRMSWAEALRAARLRRPVRRAARPGHASTRRRACVRRLGELAAFATSIAAGLRRLRARRTAARVRGMSREELLDRAAGAELLVNISGHLRDARAARAARAAARSSTSTPATRRSGTTEGRDVGLAGHDLHFTVGANVGTRALPLPTRRAALAPIRQPVVLERWPVATAGSRASRRSAAGAARTGRSAGPARTYGVKAHEFRPLADVPRAAGLPFEVVLDIHPADAADADRAARRRLDALRSPRVTRRHGRVRALRARLGRRVLAAQGVYVHTRSGWFSDRTVRYLASGRPALVQDTGRATRCRSARGC